MLSGNSFRYWIKKIEYSTFNRNQLKADFNEFEHSIWCDEHFYDSALKEAERINNENDSQDCHNDIVSLSDKLKQVLRRQFENKYKDMSCRILIYLPSVVESPAGNSLFSNWIHALRFMGFDVRPFCSSDSMEMVFDKFMPDIFLSSDTSQFTSQIDWDYLNRYRNHHNLLIGLNAYLGTDNGKTLLERLKISATRGVNFYYVNDELKYTVDVYEEIAEKFPVFGVPFSVNPFVYYPVTHQKILDYILLASINKDKWNRYVKWLRNIVKMKNGLLLGPGWRHFKLNDINPNRDRALYSMSKVGLNLHLDFQIERKNQLNERTYQLAACGLPQVIDAPKLLEDHFSDDCFFVSHSPGEYEANVSYALEDRKEAERRAINAMKVVYERHTTFHRMNEFVEDIIKTFK